MKLMQVLERIEYEVLMGDISSELIDICNDSRTAQQGSLFIAIQGYHVDAHDFLPQVLENGCRALVVDNPQKVDLSWAAEYQGLTVILVKDTLTAMALIASDFYQRPSEKINLVGVTGTNGKTSIAHLTGSCLEVLHQETAVLGTTGNRIGKQLYPTSNTTVESIKLQWLFQEMVNQSIDTCIMEVSSHALRTHRVDDVHFDYSIFTNLTEEHLDFHKDMEDYYQAKKTLFAQTEKASIINIDDAYGARLYNELKQAGKPVYSYGLSDQADYWASEIIAHHNGSDYNLNYPEGNMEVSIPIPGKIYVSNTLAVLALLHLMGSDAGEMHLATKGIKAVDGRLEVVKNDLGATVVVDYAHSPDALEKVIEVCREFTSGKLYVVFGCGGDRDKTKRPVMGHIASSKADFAILTSDNPRTEEPMAIIEDVLKGIPASHREKVYVENDRHLAIAYGVEKIQKGDTLLITGKGHETYQIIGVTKNHFDDREEAALALSKR